MKSKLGRTRKSIVFIFLFSIVLIYQNQFIISTHHFTDDLKGVIQSQTIITNKAYSQSYGFFDGISNANWVKYQMRYQKQHRHVDNDVRNKRRHIDVNHGAEMGQHDNASIQKSAHLFFRDNYDGEFTCLNEMQMGVAHDHQPHLHLQTPKWLCDPQRIVASSREKIHSGGGGSLVYAFNDGAGNPSRFIKDIRDELGDECEIHVFAPHWSEKRIKHLLTLANVAIHSWGIEGKSDSHLGRKNYLTFHETIAQLGHDGHAIDVLSIDCNDGCEWSTYMDILDSDSLITQILIELHGAPYQVNDFFLEMRRNGYVAFHKESNTVEDGKSAAYSFIRLAPAFFQESASLISTVNSKTATKQMQKKPMTNALSTQHIDLPQDIQSIQSHQRRPMHLI